MLTALWTRPQNAFSDIVRNFFILLVVDLLHEFELGVWKAVFSHLIRILESQPGNLVDKLDEKYLHEPLVQKH